ncbi:MAG TPA: hypothetical protein VF041_20535 [Gemmatimonadaceae bacterium]
MSILSSLERGALESSPRRGFLGRLAGGAAALAAGTLGASSLRAQSAAPSPTDTTSAAPRAADAPRAAPCAAPCDPDAGFPPVRGAWDMSWTRKLVGPHRQVFDAPEIAEGTILHQARMYLAGYAEVYGVAGPDIHAVLVFRHRAVPMVLGDAIWAKYDFIAREAGKLADPTTGKPARRNPFLNARPGDEHAMIWPDGGLDTLLEKGAIALACNVALLGLAGRIAKRTKQAHDAVADELKRSLVPGVTLMPSGVFAVTRAEEAGCHYMRGT